MITTGQIEEIRGKFAAAKNCMDEIQKILRDEPEKSPGGEVKNISAEINKLIFKGVYLLHHIKPGNTDAGNP